LAALDLLAAAIGGAKLRKLRSSNSSVSGGISSRIIHMLFRPVLNLIVTQRLAPSDMAATWMFGKKHISNGSVKIINNGLEIDRFVFDVCKRQELREKMGLTDKFVVGHVGRISDQKNHKFLLDAFEAIKKENEAAVLLLVGRVAQPEIEISLKKRIENLGLNDSVIFTGVRSDIPDLLMAMDVFLFPSLYEGMPNAVIEAQATGLHCIISDTITKEVGFTDLVEYLPLNNPDEWAERALQYQNGYVHRNMRHEFIENGYDIESTIEWLEDYLTSHCDRLEMYSSNK
jgi:glycosyltransferase involved in cell wall biosynthesis